MGRLFAIILVIIALASAYPIVTHMYVMPEDISTHGHQIDEQLSDTMAEAGISFLLAQFVLAIFVWKVAERKDGGKLKNFSGGAKIMVAAAFIFLGTEGLPLWVFGPRTWAQGLFPSPMAQSLADPAQ